MLKVKECNQLKLDEFEPDDLEFFNDGKNTMPSYSCTGRGRKPDKASSIMQLKLPGVVVKNMKDETRSRGRGRARLLKFNVNSNSFNNASLGHGRSVSNGSPLRAKTLPHLMIHSTMVEKAQCTAPAHTPLQEVLATANERFKSYGEPKRNPARWSPGANINIYNSDQFPSLPTLDFSSFSSPRVKGDTESNSANTSSQTVVMDMVEFDTVTDAMVKHKTVTQAMVVDDTVIPTVISNDTPEGNPTINDLSKQNIATPQTVKPDIAFEALSKDAQSDDNTAAEVDELYNDMNKSKNSNSDDLANFSILAQSTPTNSGHQSKGDAGQKALECNWDESSCHMVRIENLPPHTTKSELEDIISAFGQILNLDLELLISDGKEKLSANVKLADGSIAEFLASCLDGAETIFEGTHSPVKCYIR